MISGVLLITQTDFKSQEAARSSLFLFQILHQPIEREADTMMGVNSRVQQDMKPYELYKVMMVFLSKQTMLFFLEHFALKLVMDQKASFRSHGQRIADCSVKTNGRYRKQI